MTSEQMAVNVVREFEVQQIGWTYGELRRRIADAIRAGTVDDDILADAARTVRGLLEVIKAKASYPVLSASWETLQADIREDIRRIAKQFKSETGLEPTGLRIDADSYQFDSVHAAIDRLAFILGLSPMERAFIHDAESGGAPATWMVFADWLDEQNKPTEALRMRTLFPKPGQVAVLTFPMPDSNGFAQAYREICANMFRDYGCPVIMLYDGQSLDMLDEEDMHRAGWVRSRLSGPIDSLALPPHVMPPDGETRFASTVVPPDDLRRR